MDGQQAYPLTSASNSVALKTRSPSICRSESASLRLDSGSIVSVTDSERTISTVESSTLSEYFSLRSTNGGSSISLADSVKTVTERDRDNYTSTSSDSLDSDRMPEGLFEEAKKYERIKRKARGGPDFGFWKGASVKQVKMDDLSRDDIIIAVMGPTGSGKSTFINTITGGFEVSVGHNLESCTSEISTVRLIVPELTHGDLVFVDTPSFDDTHKFDVDILKMVADWLKTTYAKGIFLSGLLYFHRITDNQMTGGLLKSLRVFKELCGRNAFQSVILVTTMWDEIDEEEGKAREQELKSRYWRDMLARNCTTGRFMRTRESAFSLVDPFLRRANKRISVLLQQEMVDMNRQLSETSAGHELYSKMELLMRQRRELLDRIRNEITLAHGDEMALEPLRLEHEKLRINLEATVNEMRELKLPLGKRLIKTTEKFFGIKLTPTFLTS